MSKIIEKPAHIWKKEYSDKNGLLYINQGTVDIFQWILAIYNLQILC